MISSIQTINAWIAFNVLYTACLIYVSVAIFWPHVCMHACVHACVCVCLIEFSSSKYNFVIYSYTFYAYYFEPTRICIWLHTLLCDNAIQYLINYYIYLPRCANTQSIKRTWDLCVGIDLQSMKEKCFTKCVFGLYHSSDAHWWW